MTLNNPNPVVIPPVEAKEFPHLWLYSINVIAPSVTSGRVRIETIPYNATTKELGLGKDMVAIETDDLWNAVNEVPEVADAMQSIFLAIEPLREWIAQKEAEKALENQQSEQ